jgi:hypothetical protein
MEAEVHRAGRAFRIEGWSSETVWGGGRRLPSDGVRGVLWEEATGGRLAYGMGLAGQT